MKEAELNAHQRLNHAWEYIHANSEGLSNEVYFFCLRSIMFASQLVSLNSNPKARLF